MIVTDEDNILLRININFSTIQDALKIISQIKNCWQNFHFTSPYRIIYIFSFSHFLDDAIQLRFPKWSCDNFRCITCSKKAETCFFWTFVNKGVTIF